MTYIRSVLGDIMPSRAGRCYSHEHIIIDHSYATEKYPEFELSDVEKAVTELIDFHEAGGGLMIDTMPCGCGRNVDKLAAVSRQSGVHIVCPTGLHLEKYYPPHHWSRQVDVDEMAVRFVDDILLGIDINDYNGPDISRTEYRAGVIKVAGGDPLTGRQKLLFSAAAAASKRTGCPIITHCEEGKAAIEQAELLLSCGVAPSNIVLSHTDRLPEIEYHRALLNLGIFLEYDSAFRWKSGVNHTSLLLLSLAPEYPNQLLLGMDAARSSYWKSYGGGPGLTFLLLEYSSEIIGSGLDPSLLNRIFDDNPKTAYTFQSIK